MDKEMKNNKHYRIRLTKHLDESGLTYFQHMRRAITISLSLAWCVLALIVHAFAPFIFENTASEILENINEKHFKD